MAWKDMAPWVDFWTDIFYAAVHSGQFTINEARAAADEAVKCAIERFGGE